MRARADRALVLAAAVLAAACAARPRADADSMRGAETVVVPAGSVALRALLWRPPGRGPFPAVLLLHGSGRTPEDLKRLGPYEDQAPVLGPVFARHGYEFLYLFRRGVGLSADQGTNAVDLLTAEAAAHGQAGRNALQLQLLEGRELADARAGLAFLRTRGEVDPRKIAVVGHSFGGSLAIVLAGSEPDLRAVVVFSGAGYSWDRSPKLRARLLDASARAAASLFYIHAENDYSLNPGRALDAHLAKLGKPHLLKIYPPVGRTPDEGHGMLYLAVSEWELDVFAFLDEAVRR